LGHSILFLAIALPVCLSIVVLSAGYFVKGAVAIAHRLSVPEFIVGSVIVAIGTSAPEVAINISAVIEGAGDIVISNIVGSNIVNIGLGIGVAGLILRFGQARPEYIRTIFIGLAGAIALLANTLISGTSGSLSTLGFPFALALLAAFAYFMYTSIRNSDSSQDEHFDSNVPLFLAIGFVVGGTIAMAFFSNLAVEYAVALSQRMGIPEAVIGATVIAIGGSLPEVSSCIAAARIKRPNLILGNVAGSQIFNILGILGLSGALRSFNYSTTLAVDIAVLIAMTLVLLGCFWFARLRPAIGWALISCYGIYVVYLIAISR
jgi:cation:H+ antiporter